MILTQVVGVDACPNGTSVHIRRVGCTFRDRVRSVEFVCMVILLHELNFRPLQKVLTNSLLTGEDDEEGETLQCANVAVKLIKAKLDANAELPDDTVIVIDVRHDLGCVHYYCASWERRCVFWLHKVAVEILARNDRPVYCKSHLGEP